MQESNFQVLFTKTQIQERILVLSREISEYYASETAPVVAVCVLKGAFVFFADLFRKLQFQPEIDFVRLASYGQKTYSSGDVVFRKNLETSVEGKHVLIIEDIVDTGYTIDSLTKHLWAQNPQSVKVCSFIFKEERKQKDVPVDFYGFYLEKGFVVGYGLDWAEKYRHLEDLMIIPQ